MSYSDIGEESTLHLQRLSWTFTPETKQNASWWLTDNAGCYKRHFGGSEQVCKTPNSFLTTRWAEARYHGRADSTTAASSRGCLPHVKRYDCIALTLTESTNRKPNIHTSTCICPCVLYECIIQYMMLGEPQITWGSILRDRGKCP